MSYIPEIRAIIKRISEQKSDSNTTNVSLSSQIAAVIGSRHQHRIIFPPVVLIKYLTTGDKSDLQKAEKIDAFLAYKAMGQDYYSMPKGKMYKEILYPCMFGTHLSDMSMLEKMTNYTGWSIR